MHLQFKECNLKLKFLNFFFSFFLCKTYATTVIKKKQSSRRENNSLQLQSPVLQPWKKLLPLSKEEKSDAFPESLVLSA